MTSTAVFVDMSLGWWKASTIYSRVFGTPVTPSSGLAGLASLYAHSRTQANVSSHLSELSNLYGKAYQVLDLANDLSDNNVKSLFNRQSASSSNPAAANLAYFNPDNSSGSVPDSTFQFDITQKAGNQINNGTALNPAVLSLAAGAKNFTMTVGAVQYDLSITVIPADTNRDVLNAMAAAINAANSGVTASVQTNSNGTIQLRLDGQTGLGGAFSLIDSSGAAVTTTGANQTTQFASNASFTLNGAAHSQSNNNVYLLGGNLQVTLAGPGKATVTVGPDQASLTSTVSALVEAMNDLNSYLHNTPSLRSSLSRDWGSMLAPTAGKLSYYGISPGGSGQVSFNSSKFSAALQKNSTAVRQAMAGERGLIPALKTFTSQIISSPGASLLQANPLNTYSYTSRYGQAGSVLTEMNLPIFIRVA
jgi:flagellar capping protein FliD